jgi:Flp pilus assembly protein TadG
MSLLKHAGTFGRRIAHDTSGVAMIEFAFVLPILALMGLTGAEMTNYITVKMRMSQMALSIADNAARIGNGTSLAAKTITEVDINDVFTGAQIQAGGLNLQTNGRVFLSQIIPVANPNTSLRYKVQWKRCYGVKTAVVALYPRAGQDPTNMALGMGPSGREVGAQDDNATMFVELHYFYKPLIKTDWAPATEIVETASMAVRDRRDLSDDTLKADGTTNPNPTHPLSVYKVAGVAASAC